MNPSPWLSFFFLLLLVPLSSEAQLEYDLTLNTVPLDDLANVWGTRTAPFLDEVSLSNATTQSSTYASASSWWNFSGKNVISNITSNRGANSANSSLFVDDSLTISGDNIGANASVEFEIEIEGKFQLENGYVPASGDPAFDGLGRLRFRSESSRYTALKVIEVRLQGLLDPLAPRPRRETATFPFRLRATVLHLIKVGESFSLDLNFLSTASVISGDFIGEPPDREEFGPVSNLNSLITTTDGRLIGIHVVNESVQNPTISSSSGIDYSPLLARPSDSFRITDFEIDPTTGHLALEWETSSSAAFFQIRKTTDLSLPRQDWTLFADSVSRQSTFTRYETTLDLPLPERLFFVVEEK